MVAHLLLFRGSPAFVFPERAKERAMLYSKPLSGRMVGATGLTGAPNKPARVMRGVPLGGAAPDFAAMMGSAGGLVPGGAQGAKNPAQAANAANAATLEDMAKQSTMGLSQTRAMATLAKVMQDSPKPLGTLNSANAAGGINGLNPLRLPSSFQRPKGLEGAETDLRVKSHRKKNKPQERMAELVTRAMDFTGLRQGQKTVGDGAPAAAAGGKSATAGKIPAGAAAAKDAGVGQLAAQFESGREGIAAIGYDRHGGTSYGKYQISSRAGTMRSFMEFLKTEEPDFAKRLESAGPANTGGKGGRMPAVWKEIAAENPERFEILQEKFIHDSHFEPAMRSVAEKTGLGFDEMSVALKEVLFSTAVQHGPAGAVRIVSRAVDQVGQDKLDPDKNSPEGVKKAGENLIRRIYAMRANQFGSSTEAVQASVKNRLRQEMSLALGMLRQETVAA